MYTLEGYTSTDGTREPPTPTHVPQSQGRAKNCLSNLDQRGML